MLGGIKIVDMERLYTSQLANNLSTHKRALKVNDMHTLRSIYLKLTEFGWVNVKTSAMATFLLDIALLLLTC